MLCPFRRCTATSSSPPPWAATVEASTECRVRAGGEGRGSDAGTMQERLPITATPYDAATARAVRRATADGGRQRVGHGRTVDKAAFDAADGRTQHLARVDAVIGTSRAGLIVSHASAVALHGLPWFGPFPERVTVTDPTRDRAQRLRWSDKMPGRGRTIATVQRHGHVVTDLVTTGVDVALRSDRGHALAVLDAVLRRGVRGEQLHAELEARSTMRGRARAARLIDLADLRSESVGESITRLVAYDLRLPEPVLQHEFRDGRDALIARVDLWFPEQGVVVEFDGLAKYRDPTLRAGRSAEEVVVDEKIREDRVRSRSDVSGIARVIWRHVMPGGAAPAVLRAAGLPVPRGIDITPHWR